MITHRRSQPSKKRWNLRQYLLLEPNPSDIHTQRYRRTLMNGRPAMRKVGYEVDDRCDSRSDLQPN